MSHAYACARCGGLMRVERVRRTRVQLLACFTCGDRTDDTILENRRWMAEQGDHDWKASLWERIRMLARLECAA